MIISGVTPSGFKFAISEERFSDWRTVKALARLNEFENIEDDPQSVVGFINAMDKVERCLFKDGGEKLEKYILKKNNGYVAPQILFNDLIAIFKAAKRTKNS